MKNKNNIIKLIKNVILIIFLFASINIGAIEIDENMPWSYQGIYAFKGIDTLFNDPATNFRPSQTLSLKIINEQVKSIYHDDAYAAYASILYIQSIKKHPGTIMLTIDPQYPGNISLRQLNITLKIPDTSFVKKISINDIWPVNIYVDFNKEKFANLFKQIILDSEINYLLLFDPESNPVITPKRLVKPYLAENICSDEMIKQIQSSLAQKNISIKRNDLINICNDSIKWLNIPAKKLYISHFHGENVVTENLIDFLTRIYRQNVQN